MKKSTPKTKKRVLPTKPAKKSAKTRTTKPVLFPVVGIGASAGGLEAFTKLLEHMPDKTGMAFVLVQHLSPGHESILTQLLERTVHLPIREVKDGMSVEPDHVYVIPPNTNMTIEEGVLRLEPRPDVRGPHLPIDLFFSSLAADRGNAAIGVVLSGSASDGVNGLKEIKTAGGITLAQDEDSAAYTGMPRSAAASGCVDFILTPAAIATELVKISSHAYLSPAESGADEILPTESGPFHQILALLHRHSGVDFTHYKHTTVKRRIVRRMVLNKVEDPSRYLKHLKKTPSEVDALCEDLTIHVTSFFRDPEVFEALRTKVFPSIVKDRDPEQPIRMWIAGCSTGEEAYSMAITLLEFLGDRSITVPIQIFASDVSEMAIDRARAGIYAADIEASVSPERLKRFFTKSNGGWRITKAVREMCVFAKQDMTKDPPFSHMDLISCRNVLIFMGPVLQKKILPVFHYALKPEAHLLLGTAESIGGFANLFSAVDQRNKIFVKRAVPSRLPLYPAHAPADAKALHAQDLPAATPEINFQHEADRIILSRFGPAGVVVDDQMKIVQFRGHTGPYLEPVPGDASLDLLKMVHADLLPDLRITLKKAKKSGTPTSRDGLQFKHDGTITELDLEVIPMKVPGLPGSCFLILFEERAHVEAARQRKGATKPALQKMESAKKGSVEQLQRELETSRAYLQSIIEEKETTTEELRSANEEIQSSNEELQSTNEELETSKEELQSTNEELITVNEELQNRNAELAVTLDDLNNLLVSSSIPIIIVGRDLKIRRFTPMAESVLNIIDTDIGRKIGDLKPNITVSDLEGMVEKVMETLAIAEHNVQDKKGHWYSLRLRPYRTTDHRIDGVVLSLIDIDAMKRTQARIEAEREYASNIFETVREPLIVMDDEFRITSANKAFYTTFRTDPKETEQRIIFELGNRQWDIPSLRHAMEKILPRQQSLRDYEIVHDFPTIGERIMLLNARKIWQLEGASSKPLILLAIEDVTEGRQAKKELEDTARFPSENPDPVLRIARDKTIIYANKSAEHLLFEGKAAKGQAAPDYLGKLVNDIMKSDSTKFNIETREKDNRTYSWSIAPIVESGYVNAYGKDVTELKAAESKLQEYSMHLEKLVNDRTRELMKTQEKLTRAQKLALIGQLSGGIAHDLRNPLSTIMNTLYLMEKNRGGKDIAEHILKIQGAVRRSEKIIINLLNLARSEKPVPVTISTPDLASSCLEMQPPPLGIKIVTHLSPQTPPAKANQEQMEIVLCNLIFNAYQAMTDGEGELTISNGVKGDKVYIAVTDTGCGISKKNLEEIFEPLFTTKGKGLGLGLAVVKAVIESNEGTVEVESVEEKGSTFTIYLPKAE